VVGGGIAGLAAAAFASKGGASVLLLEASPRFGGRARTRNVAGYHFNQGAHALYRGGFLDNVLHDLDVAVTGSAPDLASGFFVSDNTLHQAPFSAAGLACTTLLSDAEKSETASLFRRVRDRSTGTPPGTSSQDALAALAIVQRPRRARCDDAADKPRARAGDGGRSGAFRAAAWRLDAKRSLPGRRLGYDDRRLQARLHRARRLPSFRPSG